MLLVNRARLSPQSDHDRTALLRRARVARSLRGTGDGRTEGRDAKARIKISWERRSEVTVARVLAPSIETIALTERGVLAAVFIEDAHGRHTVGNKRGELLLVVSALLCDTRLLGAEMVSLAHN
jgi:hypothetical protein